MPDAPPEFPPIREAVITADEVSALFRDLQCVAVIHDIVVKGSRGTLNLCPITPALAQHMLTNREVFGIQVRYRHDHQEWTDTLMPVADGFRLVRIAHPAESQ